MIIKKNIVIKDLYEKIKSIVDLYRSKNISSIDINRYFTIKKNFKSLLNNLKDMRYLYDKHENDITFEDTVREILNKIIKDRIYYEQDNVSEKTILKKYEEFLSENSSDFAYVERFFH